EAPVPIAIAAEFLISTKFCTEAARTRPIAPLVIGAVRISITLHLLAYVFFGPAPCLLVESHVSVHPFDLRYDRTRLQLLSFGEACSTHSEDEVRIVDQALHCACQSRGISRRNKDPSLPVVYQVGHTADVG